MTDQTLTCDQFDALLSAYLEGTLDRDSRAAVASHAAGCDRCRTLLTDLSSIASAAAALPSLEPSRDLWPDIAERIAAPVVPLAERPPRRREAPFVRPRYLAPVPLAAAAALLVAATAGVTVLAIQGRQPASPSVALGGPGAARSAPAIDSLPAIPAPAPRVIAASGSRPNAVSAQEVYAREIAQLDSIVRDRRSQLDTATVAVIEKNLRIIDSAIAQSRAALAKDPNSGFLHHQLNDALNQKIDLLRTVALLPART